MKKIKQNPNDRNSYTYIQILKGLNIKPNPKIHAKPFSKSIESLTRVGARNSTNKNKHFKNTIHLKIPNFGAISPLSTVREKPKDHKNLSKIYSSYNFLTRSVVSSCQTPGIDTNVIKTQRHAEKTKNYLEDVDLSKIIRQNSTRNKNILIEDNTSNKKSDEVLPNSAIFRNRVNFSYICYNVMKSLHELIICD